jgi:hypothetical protein
VHWALVAGLLTATGAVAQSRAPAGAATVSLEVQSVCCGTTGSGLLLTPTGLIATSAHVVAGARRVRVRLSSGEVFDALGTLAYEPRLDLALILIPGTGLPSAPLAGSRSLVLGERLRAIGAPFGLGTTVTKVVLSALRTENGSRRLELSAAVSPGSAGGPVVDEEGEVVGLLVAGPAGGTGQLDSAIPIDEVRAVAGQHAGRVPKPFGDMTYAATASLPMAEPSPEAPSAAAAADLDFRPLNGVILYFEERYAGPHSVRDSTGYAVYLTPSGGLGLERHNTREWRNESTPLAELVLRTRYAISEGNRSASVCSVKPLDGGITTDSWELRIEGERYWYSAAGRIQQGAATPGVVPRELLSAVLAALPERLPPEVHVSVLDPATNRSQDVTVRFGRRQSRSIPVPRDGRTCGADVPTRTVAVDVVQATRFTETETVTGVVLARQPHVLLAGTATGMTSTLRCVVIPGLVP